MNSNLNIKYFGKSEKGRREANEDNFIIFVNSYDYLIFGVADGMGGHIGGRVASSLTIKFLKDYFNKINFANLSDEAIQNLVIQGIKYISKNLINASNEDPKLKDMGTTLNMNILINNYIYTLNIGDSRTTHFSNLILEKISEDHNLAALSKRDSNYKAYENFSNFLTSSLGPNKETRVDFYKTKLTSYGYLITTSDGVHNHIYDQELINILNNNNLEIKDKINRIIEKAFNNNSNDNMTCILMEYRI